MRTARNTPSIIGRAWRILRLAIKCTSFLLISSPDRFACREIRFLLCGLISWNTDIFGCSADNFCYFAQSITCIQLERTWHPKCLVASREREVPTGHSNEYSQYPLKSSCSSTRSQCFFIGRLRKRGSQTGSPAAPRSCTTGSPVPTTRWPNAEKSTARGPNRLSRLSGLENVLQLFYMQGFGKNC